MARHRDIHKRPGIVAGARRPALLGGVLGGGTALVIGLVSCAVLSTTGVGVHFTFTDRADASVVGSRNDEPAVTRDLAAATPSPGATMPSPSAGAATRAAKAGARPAAEKSAAAQAAAAPVAVESATPTPAARASAAAPASGPSPSASPSDPASPAPSPSPSTVPQLPAATPQPSSGASDGSAGDAQDGTCLLGVICF